MLLAEILPGSPRPAGESANGGVDRATVVLAAARERVNATGAAATIGVIGQLLKKFAGRPPDTMPEPSR